MCYVLRKAVLELGVFCTVLADATGSQLNLSLVFSHALRLCLARLVTHRNDSDE